MTGFWTLYKPAATKPVLLAAAGTLWAFAGILLGSRGYLFILSRHPDPSLYVSIGVVAGIVFFMTTFRTIADRYIQRILSLGQDRPCFFSFFSLRGYVVMLLMISLGICLRGIAAIPRDDLGTVYLTIATPLVSSSFLFFRTSFLARRGSS